jgi:hypothetical protein
VAASCFAAAAFAFGPEKTVNRARPQVGPGRARHDRARHPHGNVLSAVYSFGAVRLPIVLHAGEQSAVNLKKLP